MEASSSDELVLGSIIDDSGSIFDINEAIAVVIRLILVIEISISIEKTKKEEVEVEFRVYPCHIG